MNVLGICNTFDSGAALIIDGVVIAAANEERFLREKQTKEFPKNAIEYVLSEGDLTIDNIDLVGCGAWAGIDMYHTLPSLVDDSVRLTSDADEISMVKQRIQASLKSDKAGRSSLLKSIRQIGIPEWKVIFCDHHLAHACAAFFPSPFENAIIMIADGRGDFRSASIWRADRAGGISHINTVSELSSIGAMYGFITKLLGFRPHRHEGKITGLAAYGKTSEVVAHLKEGIFFNPDSGRIESKFTDYYLPFVSAELPELQALTKTVPREDFAFAAQQVIEDVLTQYLSFHIKSNYEVPVNLCLGGGCAANVKLNFELSKIPEVENVYVAPSMGDAGNALGGAIHVATSMDERSHIQMENVYLGSAFTSEEIAFVCSEEKLDYRVLEDSVKQNYLLQCLEEGKIIGWFRGRMEFGPRALGNRSIIASPADPAINEQLNQRLSRTEFMPFAPVTTEDLAPLCFIDWKKDQPTSYFMTMCYECTKFMIEECPATVHIDKTARPQIVRRSDNPEYHDLIKNYYELTGRPALINTSFNHHEEPIVRTPHDAIRSFLKGNVDVLAMEAVVVE